MRDQMTVHFYGFSPSDFSREYLTNKLAAIQDEAPYGAQVRAVFSRRQNIFKGVITIHSAVGKFLAVSSGQKLKMVTQNLSDQLRRQIDRWKARRFERISLKNFTLKDSPTEKDGTDSVA